jgi:hypothetical protein
MNRWNWARTEWTVARGRFKPTAAPPVSGSGAEHLRRLVSAAIPARPRRWRRPGRPGAWLNPHHLDAGYKRATTPAANSSFFLLHFRRNRSSTRHCSTLVSRRSNHPFLDSFRLEDHLELTMLFPHFLQLELHSFDPGTGSHRRHPPVRARLRAARRR